MLLVTKYNQNIWKKNQLWFQLPGAISTMVSPIPEILKEKSGFVKNKKKWK